MVKKLGKPYDLRCTRGTEERHVEVKGTTGAATSVELTINEVLHARDQGHGATVGRAGDRPVPSR